MPTLSDDPGDAPEVMEALATGGIDFADVSRALEEEGIRKFTASFDKILASCARSGAPWRTSSSARLGGQRRCASRQA
jgi:hypothetical protein